MERPRIRPLMTLVALTALVAFPGTAARASIEGVPSFGHVFVIIGENTELGQINKSNAPYIMNTLKPHSAWMTNYFALTHFSEANYVGMMSGQYTKCQQFDYSAASCHQDVNNLFHQLDRVGVSWQAWSESMPAPCYLKSTGSAKALNHYGSKHNPPIFFDDIEGAGGVWSTSPDGLQGTSAECLANDLPMGGTGANDTSVFDDALAKGNVGQFNFIVPNECEDAHDNCKPAGPSISQFDSFLSREVPAILHSQVFTSDPNSVLIVTFDEGSSNRGDGNGNQFAGGGNVLFAAVGPGVQNGTYAQVADHYSLLRTLEDGYGITSYLGGAGSASPIAIWKP